MLSCDEHSNNQVSSSCDPFGLTPISRDEKRQIIAEGDVEVYEKFKNERFFKEPETVIFYSLIMALKHQNAEAYYDVYLYTGQALDMYGLAWEDSVMLKFTLPFLYQAAELGDEQALDSKYYEGANTIDSLPADE